MSDISGEHELQADRELRSALRAAIPEPPEAEVDWNALRRRVGAGAATRLARRTNPGPRRRRALGWVLAAVPAAAAAVVLALGARPDPEPPILPPRITAEEALRAPLSESGFRLLVSGYAETDALLRIAVDEG